MSLFHILVKAEVPANDQFPRHFNRLVIALILRKDPSDEASQDLNLSIFHEDTKLHETVLPVNFQDKNTYQMIVHLGGLPIPGFGKIHFQVHGPNDFLSQYELEIAPAQASTAANGQ